MKLWNGYPKLLFQECTWSILYLGVSLLTRSLSMINRILMVQYVCGKFVLYVITSTWNHKSNMCPLGCLGHNRKKMVELLLNLHRWCFIIHLIWLKIKLWASLNSHLFIKLFNKTLPIYFYSDINLSLQLK